MDDKGEVQCDLPTNGTKDIVFKIGDLDLRITPADYLDTENPKTKRCKFFGIESGKLQ
jgi:hypothetical protein